MATSIVPKSEIRRNENIIVGFGEVPSVDTVNGTGWGLPGGILTYSRTEATEMAQRLDQIIRSAVRNPADLLP